MGATGGAKRGRGRGRGRPRGRARGGRGPGRPRKNMVIESDEEEQKIETSETVDNLVDIADDSVYVDVKVERPDAIKTPEKPLTAECNFDIDGDISQLVPVSFTTITKGPPQPMLELDWNQRYTPIGERLPNPNIHMCDMCRLPIRIYGRMIPCKHVFCFSCSLERRFQCPRCSEKVHRIERNNIGSLHMCLHDGSRYGYDGCRRTYLSQRDLQAHINHRHKPRNSGSYHVDSISSSSQIAPFYGATRARADSQSRSRTPPVRNQDLYPNPSSAHPHQRFDRDRMRAAERDRISGLHQQQRASSSSWQNNEYYYRRTPLE